MYSLKALLEQPPRLALTVGGVALCVILMLFLLSVYRGAADGSVEYVRASDADLWVLQRHATNVLRSTSLLGTRHGFVLRKTDGVASAAPVLFILGAVKTRFGQATTYLTGFDPATGRGGPPRIVAGRSVASDDEIVLDRSFAAKYRIVLGDRLPIKDESLTVVGLSGGTNMFVIQYAFVTLSKAQDLLGVPFTVSGYLVKLAIGADLPAAVASIRTQLKDVAVYDRDTFLANNFREMQSGILPLLYTVAVIGAVVLTAILSLILSVSVLERRKDFAVMKALGAPGGFVPGLVIQQALMLAGSGLAVGIGLFFPLVALVSKVSPEVSVMTSPRQLIGVALAAAAISLVSSIVPIRRLRHIYPLEVFR